MTAAAAQPTGDAAAVFTGHKEAKGAPMTGTELKTWRERGGLSPLAAAELLGIELWRLAAYEGDMVPIPAYLERLVRDLTTNRRNELT